MLSAPHIGFARAARVPLAFFILLFALMGSALALDPKRSLSQYASTTWTEEHGLPQDTIRAITQTTDGYLWLGTDEGLARFDGYEFVVFNKTKGNLPGGSVAALAAAADGVLWIGTSSGLTRYHERKFRTYTTKDGLPDNAVTELLVDHAGAVWIVAGAYLSRLADGRFTNFAPGTDVPLPAVRHICEDMQHVIWAGGLGAVVKMEGGKFVTAFDDSVLRGDYVTTLMSDRSGNVWIGSSTGLLKRSPSGALRKYDTRDGLPDPLLRALSEDRDGNIWVGTNAGAARLADDHFTAARPGSGNDRGIVRCLFEDREGSLWLGSSAGLSRLRDTVFMAYGTPEGLPGDEPNTVFQDRAGRIWVGFHDSGLMRFSPGPPRVYTMRDGLPSNEIWAIREARNGDLIIGASRGMVRLHDERITTYVPPHPLARFNIYDTLEDSAGNLWLATPGGLAEVSGGRFRIVAPGGPTLANATVALAATNDGAIWAGTYGKGLWRVQGEEVRNFTEADGLSSGQIHSLHADSDGTLWIGTFEGGLNAFRNGRFFHYTAKDGLLSDNIADVVEDGESLWLATTRGICRIAKQQLHQFDEGKRRALEPVNFGVEDGLRSAQCAPSYPVGGGGLRTTDGRMWFTTSRGLAAYSPGARRQTALAPVIQLVEVDVDDQPADLSRPLSLRSGNDRIQIRYAAIHLSAPERVQYSYMLSGIDTHWVKAGIRRTINYNTLPHGHYVFTVRAEIPEGLSAERSFAFDVLPRFYESAWFRVLAAFTLAAMAWGVFRLRLRQVRGRFSLVLQERARLAREIHDTLAQGFVGISSQLDAVAMCLPDETKPARKHLDMARRMARHSLTEARRSVMDLRASALEGQDLAAALESGARQWTAGSGVQVDVQAAAPADPLPEEMEQHLLRIAQEAVTNVVKHAGASRIAIQLYAEARKLYLRIKDDGRGFVPDSAFSSLAGHFGVLGMRERAERLGGELRLASHPGEGTEVEVKVPLP